MLNVQNLAIQYGAQSLFAEATFACKHSQCFAITGKNGAGKSSLLRVMAQQETPSAGSVSLPAEGQLGFLKQDHFKYENWRIVDVVVSGKDALWQALQAKEVLLSKSDFTEEDGMELATLEEAIAHHNGYEAESIAQTLLSGLGIPQAKHFNTMQVLSGGFKLRVLLAQVLFQNPDVLLLDEPTNHLDITSIHWLEEYLKGEYEGILIYVSHDRHFLNSVSTHILDIDYDTVTSYTGNYDSAMTQKILAEEQRLHARKNQEAKIDQLQSFVDRFGAKATKAKQAQSKQKQIDKIALTEVKTTNRRAPYFKFTQNRPSGKQVLEITGIHKSYNQQQVLNQVDFRCNRGEKVAIIGPNGIGKSTLLKILLERVQADEGGFEWGYETHVGYFAQDHNEQLDGKQTVLNWLTEQSPADMRDKVRNILGQMLFSGDDVHKTLPQLSGGEAGRLVLASLMSQKPNVLIIDEPTNHLDLEAIEALSDALKDYPGTCLFVSHDRDFVRALATRIIVLTPDGVEDITASYDDYLDAAGEDYLNREKKAATKTATPKAKAQNTGKQTKPSTKHIEKLQKTIEHLENQLLQLDTALSAPDFYQTHSEAEVNSLNAKRTDLQTQLDTALAEWEAAMQ